MKKNILLMLLCIVPFLSRAQQENYPRREKNKANREMRQAQYHDEILVGNFRGACLQNAKPGPNLGRVNFDEDDPTQIEEFMNMYPQLRKYFVVKFAQWSRSMISVYDPCLQSLWVKIPPEEDWKAWQALRELFGNR